MKFYFTLLIVLFSFTVFGQEPSSILFKSGEHLPEKNLNQPPEVLSQEIIEQTYFRILTFEEIPNIASKRELEKAGIRLLNFLPNSSFYAAIDISADLQILKKHHVLSIERIHPDFKLSKKLHQEEYGEWAVDVNNNISLQANYFESVALEEVKQQLDRLGVQIDSTNTFIHNVHFTVDIEKLDQLYDLPVFYYFEQKDAPEKPEGIQDVANHRSNYINSTLDNGLKYDGQGVNVMIQDDGIIGPHIDYKGRIELRTSNNSGNHGDHCSGILMGAGNKDPKGVGNATGAFLFVYNSSNANYGDIPSIFNNDGVVITSKSYSNGQNAGYTNLARTLDLQSRFYEPLLHVFSAGNAGTQDYGYGAGPGWGNITGGHKQGKNVIAVGNVNQNDVLTNSSSRGPAADGRIKPDICAVGTGVYSTIDEHSYDSKTGTSMSCPAISGNLAQLYQAYKEMNGGQNPDNALMKGLILNTADDLGNPGPDFRFGWGRINVRRAFEVLQAENYISDEVEHGDNQQHTIEVPENTAELRVMVYWTDFEGTVSSSKALINDIDIQLTDPNGVTYDPWVLNPAPNSSTLNMPATRGNDDLNNVEQITIDAPGEGEYTLNVSGTLIPQGPQKYYVIYEFVKDDITLTHPVGGESFSTGIPTSIRWDAYSISGAFEIEYSIDNGQSWTSTNQTIPGTFRSFNWIPPNEITGKAKIRISRNGQQSESPEPFSILRSPNFIDVEWACPNSFNVSWNSVSGATGYVVYLLGEFYMDSVGTTTETNLTVYANSNETQWISVKALGPNQAESRRAIAVEKEPGTFDCTLSPPVASFAPACSETGSGSCIRFYDLSQNAGQGSAWEWYFPGGNPETSNVENPLICYDAEGEYTVKLIVRNGVGSDSIEIENVIEVKDGQPLPFVEGFESGMPQGWETSSANGVIKINNSVSGFGEGANSLWMDNHLSAKEEKTNIMTPGINLSGNELYDLSFDVAYSLDGGADTLVIYTTNDCGETLQEIYRAGGNDLASTTSNIDNFIPNENQWKRQFVTIENTQEATSMRFIFENISDNGNNIFVDNINILLSQDNFPGGSNIIYPNPFDENINITGIDYLEDVTIKIYSYSGQMVYNNSFQSPGGVLTVELQNLSQGPYFMHLLSDQNNSVYKLIKVSP